MAINQTALDSSLQGSSVTIVGYGFNNGFARTGGGVKRIASTTLDGWNDQLVQTGNGSTGICYGDSGGPVIATMNGVDTIIGVNSFGALFCVDQANSTRPDTNLDFISQYVP
jgi:hypothetical protein